MKHWFIDHWKSMSRKDQSILIVLSVLLGTLLFYSLCWSPIKNGIEKLSLTIQKKQIQLALMKQQAMEIDTKNKRYQLTNTSTEELKNLIEASSKMHKINVKIKASNRQSVNISIAGINFNLWIEWVDALQSETGLKINACDIAPASQTGEVNITGTLVAAP
ncbi:MAG: type II secretion system protein M [Methylophilaceae bacterium]|nr:type II secretion system protein M [Methylophilaceae bacterium]